MSFDKLILSTDLNDGCLSPTGFPFPVMITACHMMVKLLLTRIINRCQPPDKRVQPLPCNLSLR
jgi:hypothetical protein